MRHKKKIPVRSRLRTRRSASAGEPRCRGTEVRDRREADVRGRRGAEVRIASCPELPSGGPFLPYSPFTVATLPSGWLFSLQDGYSAFRVASAAIPMA